MMDISKDSIKNELHELFHKLETERDELKVRAHLTIVELEQAWSATETKWNTLKSQLDSIDKGIENATGDFGNGFKALGKEIKHAYKDIRLGIQSSQLTK
jgi:hypothetical protein